MANCRSAGFGTQAVEDVIGNLNACLGEEVEEVDISLLVGKLPESCQKLFRSILENGVVDQNHPFVFAGDDSVVQFLQGNTRLCVFSIILRSRVALLTWPLTRKDAPRLGQRVLELLSEECLIYPLSWLEMPSECDDVSDFSQYLVDMEGKLRDASGFSSHYWTLATREREADYKKMTLYSMKKHSTAIDDTLSSTTRTSAKPT